MNAPLPSDLFPQRRDNGVVTDAAMRDPERAPEFLPTQHESEVGEATLAKRTDYQLGNPELPIWEYRERIVDAVNSSQATVVTAETGAGKSTQLPQFLAEEGYDVIVTQPRVVAARSVAERVGDEVTAKYGDDFKDFVGYRTARERNDSDENQILFVTDGLQLVRELAGRGVGRKQVLVLDEVHEWNENMEVLVAWAKRRISEDPNFKVVVMSATMEAGKLSEYFAEGKREVPVIEVPGRTFDVKKSEGGDVAHEAIQFAQAGKNTLVFVPGKDEISLVMGEIGRANIPGATVLPLHGQLSAEEQRRVFAKYPGAKLIVATNVAQTSITIDDIDAVVDSGMERRVEVRSGVEGLFLNPISQADCLQRAGRAGRTKEGEYVLAQLAMRHGNAPFVKLADREAYGTPEIMRTRLDGMVLRLAKAGFDASELEFYHQPDHTDILAAKARLQKLGALTEEGRITKVGRDMERMPVESHYARMMIEARKYGPEVQAQLAAMLAIEEADGILQFLKPPYEGTEKWRAMLGDDQDSDVIKQLEVYIAVAKMSDSQRRDSNIFVKAYKNARDIEKQLRRIEQLDDGALTTPTPEQREQLVRCIIAGMVDNLYTSDAAARSSYYRNAQGEHRETGNRTLIRTAAMVVGTPFDLQIVTRRGPTTLHLIESATNVPSIDVLREVAPQLFTEARSRFVIRLGGKVGEEWAQRFNGQAMGAGEVRDSQPSEARTAYIIDYLLGSLYQHDPYRDITDEIGRLQRKTAEPLRTITHDDMRGMMEVALPLEVDTIDDARLFWPEVTIDDVLPLAERMRIDDENPDEYMGVPIHYDTGRAYVPTSVDTDRLLEVFGSGRTLPSGKAVMFGNGYAARPMDVVVTEAKIVRENSRQSAEKARLDQEGAERGLPANIEIWRRVGGATNCGNGWVISPDGTLREPDTAPSDRYGRSATPDGILRWDQTRPGEVVLEWAKQDVVSPHRFEVVHLPQEGLTPAQTAKIAEIQSGIAQSWSVYDARGDRSSPPVGRGWGLDPGYAERAAARDELTRQVEAALDKLDDVSNDIPDHLHRQVDTLRGRAERLLEPGADTHHEYGNHVKQVVSLVSKLLGDIATYESAQHTGEVTIDQLEALKKRFS